MAVDKQTLGAAIAICGTGGGGGSIGAYTFKGSVATVDDLPTLANEVGDIYDVQATGMNYAWTGTTWDALGQIVDVQAIEDEIADKEDKSETMTMAQYEALTPAQKADGTTRFITDANAYPDAGSVGF